MSLGERIKLIRLENGLTMEEFGKKFNTSKGTVNNWEKGRNKPNKKNMKTIAELGGIKFGELIEKPTSCTWCNPNDNNIESEMISLGISSSERLNIKGYASYDEATVYINIFSDSDSEEIDGYVKIKYCPFCGRHLEHDVSVYD